MAFTTAVLLFMMSLAVASTHHSHKLRYSAYHKLPHHQVCSEPADLHEQWNRLYTTQLMGQMHETFYLIPFLREAATNQTRRHNFNMKHLNRTTVFSGSSQCPKEQDEDFLRQGDPCPVYYTLNSDPHRYPHVLLEAQCKCALCQGISLRRTKGRAVLPTCEGVYYHIRVLRRLPECVDNVYQYAQAWEKVQIGCSCRLVGRV